jgi:hypothetical protein
MQNSTARLPESWENPMAGHLKKGFPLGLKPIHFWGVIGTAEAMPCYKTSPPVSFPAACEARTFN